MKKILVAVDGSIASMRAARLALEIARATGASLTAAFCVATPVVAGELPFLLISEVMNAELARGKELLQELAKELSSPEIVPLLLEGPPAERLAEVAEKDDFDLVVVGSRGRNAVARMLLGSVADRLVHICKQPVLVAR